MSDPRLDPERITTWKASDNRWATDAPWVALDIVKAIAEAPEPFPEYAEHDCKDVCEICNICDMRRWWKAARALVGGDAHE